MQRAVHFLPACDTAPRGVRQLREQFSKSDSAAAVRRHAESRKECRGGLRRPGAKDPFEERDGFARQVRSVKEPWRGIPAKSPALFI